MSTQASHAALITAWGQLPIYTVNTLPAPSPGEVQVKVLAAGLHRLVQVRGAGKHYSSGVPPHIPSVDGVGHRVSDNKPVYFMSYPTVGSFQDYVNVQEQKVTEVPGGVDPIQVAAYLNPVMSSWMALTVRTERLPKGFSVLIVGATGTSGSIVVQVTRALGAGKVLGLGRNEASLDALNLDGKIVLNSSDVTKTDCNTAADVDVVLDYLYGPVARHLLSSIRSKRRTQYVQMGYIAGDDVPLSSSILRSQDLTLRGSGFGSFSREELDSQIPAILEAFKLIKPLPVRIAHLSEVGAGWGEKNERIVFKP